MGVSPERDDERLAFLDAVLESDVDGSGEIEWNEFETLVQVVQQKIAQCRREREFRIYQQMQLPPDIFLNFRHMITSIHDVFRRYDTFGIGAISCKEVPVVLLESGFHKNLKHLEEVCMEDPMICQYLAHHERVDFAVLMRIAQRVEVASEGAKGQDIQRIFDKYDLDGSGFISEDELMKLMRDVGLDAWRDIAEVSRLFDECDVDGSGAIDTQEFEILFKRVIEL